MEYCDGVQNLAEVFVHRGALPTIEEDLLPCSTLQQAQQQQLRRQSVPLCLAAMRNLERQRSFRSSRWAPGLVVAAVVTLLLVAIKRQRGETTSSPNSSSNIGEPADEHHEHHAPNDEAGDEEVNTGDEDSTGVEEAGGEEMNDEEEYVMLTEEEIGPAIQRACASAEFQQSSREVRRTWNLLKGIRIEDACARVQENFRSKNPDAAVLFDEGLSWDGQQEGVNVIIGSIIERSTDTALLDEILRLLGEKLFARGLKESYFQSLGEALVQAVEDTLGSEPEPLPSCSVAAWKHFLVTISACIVLAGSSMAARQTAVDHSSPGSKEGRPLFCVGWKREKRQLIFRTRRATVPSLSTATEKKGFPEKIFVEKAGGNRVQM